MRLLRRFVSVVVVVVGVFWLFVSFISRGHFCCQVLLKYVASRSAIIMMMSLSLSAICLIFKFEPCVC